MSRIEKVSDFLDGCAFIEYFGCLYEYAGHVKADDNNPKELHGKIILSKVTNGDCCYTSYDELLQNREFEIVY